VLVQQGRQGGQTRIDDKVLVIGGQVSPLVSAHVA
jgi:hypothetical protein